MSKKLLLLTILLLNNAALATPTEIEVVTFNIRYLNKNEAPPNHWTQRKPIVIAAMQQFNADIFGLQEALRPQLDDINKDLSGYTEFGIGRDDGKTRGEYSPILFRTHRFTLDPKESGTFWLSDTPEKIASTSWGNKIPRICTWARLTDTQTQLSFYVFNTHWDHESQASRLASAKLLTTRIENRAHPTEPVILLGDFNASKSNPAIIHLTSKLIDTFTTVHPDTPDSATFHGFKGSRNGSKIDHIFVLPNTTVTAAAILYFNHDNAFPSDHYPVRARLQFR